MWLNPGVGRGHWKGFLCSPVDFAEITFMLQWNVKPGKHIKMNLLYHMLAPQLTSTRFIKPSRYLPFIPLLTMCQTFGFVPVISSIVTTSTGDTGCCSQLLYLVRAFADNVRGGEISGDSLVQAPKSEVQKADAHKGEATCLCTVPRPDDWPTGARTQASCLFHWNISLSET